MPRRLAKDLLAHRAAAEDDLITGLLPARGRHLVMNFSGATPVSHAVF